MRTGCSSRAAPERCWLHVRNPPGARASIRRSGCAAAASMWESGSAASHASLTRAPPARDSRMPRDIPRIHAVTDDLILAHPEVTSRARGVMRALGPRGAVHLRARYLTAAQVYAIALALGDAQESTGCWLVVNERLDVA